MRKRLYNKEDVIAAALAVARREGLEQLTARKVADQLGASTAPVYSNFSTMEALGDAAKRAAVAELLDLTRADHTGDGFLNMGVGVLTFVWEWPQLYASLFLAPHEGYDPGPELFTEISRATATLPELEPLSPLERTIVLKKLAIFTHGLATEICQGCSPGCTLEHLVLMLREVGRAVVADARAGCTRTGDDARLLADLCGDCRSIPNPAKDEAS